LGVSVFRHRSGTPPRRESNTLNSNTNMLRWRGPDRRRSEPRSRSHFRRHIKALGQIL
jgi:hypothetical protein